MCALIEIIVRILFFYLFCGSNDDDRLNSQL